MRLKRKHVGMLSMKIKERFRVYRLMIIFMGLSLIFLLVTPAAAEETQKEIEYEAGFYYTVKKGDTLWDISQRFSDTPWQWPDLWKENDQLPNPHWIYPGERIRLYRKSDKHRYQTSKKVVATVAPHVAVSKPEPKPAPEVNFFYNRMDRVGFIRKPPVKPLGSIFKVLEDKDLISVGDQVYIRQPETGQVSDFAPGSRLVVYRTLKPTDDRHSEKKIGTQHYLLGVLSITKNEPQYAIAKVIENFRAMHPGDLLMAYDAPNPEIPVTESTPGIKGQIICTEDHTQLVGTHVVAFIDKGENDNIHRGQQYNIYYQETEAGITLSPVKVGSLIVLHTEKTTSTVFVTNASRKITPGQMIATP